MSAVPMVMLGPAVQGGAGGTKPAVEVTQNFSLTQGDSRVASWTATTDDQWPDLTGASLLFRASAAFGSLEQSMTVDVPTGTQSFSMDLTKHESLIASGVYPYDVQASWSDGRRQTLAKGFMTVELTYTDVSG